MGFKTCEFLGLMLVPRPAEHIYRITVDQRSLFRYGQDFLDIQYDPESTADPSIRCVKCSFKVFDFFVIEILALSLYPFSWSPFQKGKLLLTCCLAYKIREINLSYDGGFIDLSYDGGGGSKCPPPIFICENNRKSNKIMHCVEKKLFDWQF